MFDVRHIYYYVPPCPKCGSRRTGRYMRQPRVFPGDQWYVQTESLGSGELVRFAKRVPDNNCYCEDCGNEWHHLVTSRFMTEAEIQEEKKARCTNERYYRYLEENPKKKKTIFGKIFSFLP